MMRFVTSLGTVSIYGHKLRQRSSKQALGTGFSLGKESSIEMGCPEKLVKSLEAFRTLLDKALSGLV